MTTARRIHSITWLKSIHISKSIHLLNSILIAAPMMILSLATTAQASVDSLQWALADCPKAKVDAGRELKPGEIAQPNERVWSIAQVPEDWNQPSNGSKNKKTQPIFWWKHVGTDSSYPPVVFIHGGPASNSWAMMTKWKAAIDAYPGDFISFDHRGEGCSKTSTSNQPREAFSNYRARNIVKDIEFLRENVFGYKKWRAVGHSRGAAIIHYYLEMAPQSLESATAMGFSIQNGPQKVNYSMLRTMGYARAASAYLSKFPEDEAKALVIRKKMNDGNLCWNEIDNHTYCGGGVLDVLAGALKSVAGYDTLHDLIGQLEKGSNEDVLKLLTPKVKNDVYQHFSYIMGTNGSDFGGPDSVSSQAMKAANDPIYVAPFLSESRYVNETIAPAFNIDWHGETDWVDYQKIKTFLEQNPGFKYSLFAGDLDPIAPPELYQSELDTLGEHVNFVIMKNTGHDGILSPTLTSFIFQKELF